MPDKNTLRVLLSEAEANLKEAVAELERVKRRYELAAQVDDVARDKIATATARVEALQRQVQDLRVQLAEVETQEAARKAQLQAELAQRRERAKRELPAACAEYRQALENLAQTLAEARKKVGPILEKVMASEEAVYKSFARIEGLARAADVYEATNELLGVTLKGLEWPEPIEGPAREDLAHFVDLLVGRTVWPKRSVDPLFRVLPPPRIRRALAEAAKNTLAALAKERALRRAQHGRDRTQAPTG